MDFLSQSFPTLDQIGNNLKYFYTTFVYGKENTEPIDVPLMIGYFCHILITLLSIYLGSYISLYDVKKVCH